MITSCRSIFLIALLSQAPGCATRVGNPPKPNPASVAVPAIPELISRGSGPTSDPVGGFAGSADFLKSLGAASPSHRDVLLGFNAVGSYLDGLGLELDQPRTEIVNGVELKIIVKGDADDAAARQAVACAAGKAFYVATWRDGLPDVHAKIDLRSDEFGKFGALAAADRQFSASMSYTRTTDRHEVDAVFSGVPVANDPFVGDLAHLVERSRYRSTATADAVDYQTLQVWSEGEPAVGATPQVTVAGRLVGDTDEYAIHHTEAKLVCPSPLDRDNVAAPGWCLGFKQDAEGKGEFTSAAAAQAIWDVVKDQGLIDPATTASPVLDASCPQ